MIILYPGCKINLGLQVLDRLPNGYHNLDSIFLPLKHPCDILEITSTQSGFNLECSSPLGPQSTLEKAYLLFREKTGFAPGLQLRLVKRIPLGSGLGGGSSDAASLLLWLNETCSRPLPKYQLIKIAENIGADVPFFLQNTPARVTGIGEKVEPVTFSAKFSLVLVWPEIHVNTAWAFKELDTIRMCKGQNSLTNHCITDRKMHFEEDNSIFPVCENNLELPVFKRHPELSAIKAQFMRLGAIHSAMSGSGSTMYGIFSSKKAAQQAVKSMLKVWRHVYFVEYKGL